MYIKGNEVRLSLTGITAYIIRAGFVSDHPKNSKE